MTDVPSLPSETENRPYLKRTFLVEFDGARHCFRVCVKCSYNLDKCRGDRHRCNLAVYCVDEKGDQIFPRKELSMIKIQEYLGEQEERVIKPVRSGYWSISGGGNYVLRLNVKGESAPLMRFESNVVRDATVKEEGPNDTLIDKLVGVLKHEA